MESFVIKADVPDTPAEYHANGKWQKFSRNTRLGQMIWIGSGLVNCASMYAATSPTTVYGKKSERYARLIIEMAEQSKQSPNES